MKRIKESYFVWLIIIITVLLFWAEYAYLCCSVH